MPEQDFWERFNEGTLDRRTFIKAASLLGGAAVFGLPLLGCQPAASKQSFEVKLALSAPTCALLSVYSGISRNMFAQEGITNSVTEFAGGADQVRALVTGGFFMAATSPTAGMSALEAGESIRAIAGGSNYSSIGFLVKADSPLKKPEDLKGKKFKIGYSRPSSNSHVMAFLSLKALGIDPDDKNRVEYVATGGTADTWTAVKTGLVDVGWSTEPVISNVEVNKEGRPLWMTSDLVKDWSEMGIFTTQSNIDSNPKELKAWVTALVKAIDWVKNNYGEASKDLAKAFGVDLPVAETALKKVAKEVWTAALTKPAWESTAKAAVDFKILKAMPNWKVFINQSFLPDNLKDASY